MQIKNAQRIHLVGIKGVGMAGLAIIAAQMGKQVSGSDVEEDFITRQALQTKQIKILPGFAKSHIRQGIDLVITTGAHGGYNNPEVKQAKKLGIPVLSHAEALGKFMQLKRKRISVAGTHGKTTTTAMLAHLFSRAGYQPAYLAGTGSINSLGLPANWGDGNYFIAEADEYVTAPRYDHTPRFLWQNPTILIITNIEYDHPDVFSDLAAIRFEFRRFAEKLPADGVVIASIDSPQTELALKNFDRRIIWYGYSPRADYRIVDARIIHHSRNIGALQLAVIGRHNLSNALAALLAATEAGLSWQHAPKLLADYSGCARRFEFIGRTGKTLLYDDYAHHPTEIKTTLKAAREAYPQRKIICVFQPHTYSRTKALFNEFATAFTKADELIITDIFPSAREKQDASVSGKKLAEAARQNHAAVVYCPQLSDVVEYLTPQLLQKQLIITMGAGDVYKIHEELRKTY